MSGLCSMSHSSAKRCLFMLYCTRLIDSRPPPTATSMPSTMIRWAAMLIAMRPELQKRLIVSPGTVTGSPARIAASRAMLWPVAPSGLAQPRMTSSTSPGATLARSTAFWMTCPAMVAPWVLLKAPRTALPMGVRAVETMTASLIGPLLGFCPTIAHPAPIATEPRDSVGLELPLWTAAIRRSKMRARPPQRNLPMRRFADVQELRAAQGQILGESDWVTVTQDMIDRFAAATGDHQWIHVDRERAQASSFGTTIAH